jgi:benzoyl-CoA reductase subunit C
MDVPQVPDPAAATDFWESELRRLVQDLSEVSGRRADDAELRAAIAVYNEMRRTVRALYAARRERPWDVPTEELYLLLRAGEVVPPDEFIARATQYLAAVEADPRRPRDNSRVVIVGAFCEQPPIGLIKSIERAGCYIVDDDFLLGNRFLSHEVSLEGDPLRALAEAFVRNELRTSVLYEGDAGGKRRLMKQRVTAARADGIIFAAPSFCDPALLDQPMLRAGAEQHGIPCIAFKYSENTGQFQQFREQAGTFSDSIKLWGTS